MSFIGSLGSALGSISSAFGPIGQAIGAANTIYSTIKGFSAGKKAQKFAMQQRPGPNEERAAELYNALLDPDNPIIKKLQTQYTQTNTANFLNAIREMQYADRRAQALGRAPTFFNPERADETVNYLVSRAAPKIAGEGLTTAQTLTEKAAGGLKGFTLPEMVRRESMQEAYNNYAVGQLSGVSTPFAQAGKILEAIQGINIPQRQLDYGSTYSNNLGWIDWNRPRNILGDRYFGTLGIRG